MDTQNSEPKHHAILIGINAYPIRELKGCVRDVESIEELLKTQPTPIHIRKFTATRDSTKHSGIAEDRDSWPTYQNVTSALANLTLEAKAGDLVYIHFSGHGTRCAPQGPFSHHSAGDQALMLLQDGKIRTRALPGQRLAVALKAMTDKGLLVTLVLDCCFSGGVYRQDDDGVRFLRDEEFDSAARQDDESPGIRGNGESESRSASMLPNWFINPDGYTIFTACGPQEEAKEKEMDDGNRHGVLSYHLTHLLKSASLVTKQKEVYHRLCAILREQKSHQHPEFYGNQDHLFFGGTSTRSIAMTLPIIQRDGSIHLRVGQAHGIRVGDQFELSPWRPRFGDRDQRDTVLAQVKEARALTSDLELLNTTASVALQTDWDAQPHTRTLLRNFPISLASDLPQLDEWLAALKARSLAVCAELQRDWALFHVKRDETTAYEIIDKFGHEVINIPTLPNDIDQVCTILEHLTRYEMVKQLANETPVNDFIDSFEINFVDPRGNKIDPGSRFDVVEDELCKLVVKNTGKMDLYIFTYNLNPTWGIENIYRASYEVVPPRENGKSWRSGEFTKKMKTMIPEVMAKEGHTQCEDIIKVFVTSQPTSFDLLELPSVGDVVKQKSTNRVGLQSFQVPEEWAAFNFCIRTSSRN